VHCDHQLFPITEGFNIVDFVVNCVSIPKWLQPLLLSMSLPPFLEHWEKEFRGSFKELKKKKLEKIWADCSQSNWSQHCYIFSDLCFLFFFHFHVNTFEPSWNE
jgi:hypothetical protein